MVRRRRQLVAVTSRYLDWILRLGGIFFPPSLFLSWLGGRFREVWGVFGLILAGVGVL